MADNSNRISVNLTTNNVIVTNTDDNQLTVVQPLTDVVQVNSPGPQGPVGPQGETGPSVPFINIGNGVYATTSSLQVTGSFLVSGSSTFTNIGPAIFSGSVNATGGVTMSSALVLGDVTVLGTASINVLQINTTINSTGSNQLGDSVNDTQTLYGTVVIPTGSLTVSGSAKVNEGIFGIGTSGNILPLVNTAGTGTVVVGGTSPNTPSLRIQGSPLNFFIGSTQVAQMFTTTGNLLLQNGGTFTDAGYRLDVSGSARVTGEANVSFLSLSGNTAVNSSGTTLILGTSGGWTGVRVPRYFETTGSISAASLLARGTYLNQTLVATANNDVLVGLDIAPTFTTGAFTGVSTFGIRVSGSIRGLSDVQAWNGAASLSADSLSFNNTSTTARVLASSATTNLAFRIGSTDYAQFFNTTGNFLLQSGGTFTDAGYRLDVNGSTRVKGSGATSATTTLLLQNSTPTNLLSVLDNGQVSFTSPTMSLAASQSAFSISPIISASNIVGGQYYGVSITPTFFQTTGSQTETAFRVAATFTSSNATATSGSNIIADFGSTSAGSQLTVTDVTSGSIYMVNDVSGIPIIEATSNWDVNIYDFPNKIFEKTGSQVNIYGTMRVSGSFILPLSQSVAPQTGSAYWSGSLLFIYDGTRYRSSSFA